MTRRWLLAAACAVIAWPGAAGAQLTVHDPANYAQNLLQAVRSLEQVRNQLESLQNEARNLAPLDLRAAGALDADAARINGLLTEARRVAGDVEGLRAQYARTYGAEAGDPSRAALREAAEARWRNSLDSLRRTLEVQAEVTASLARTQAQAGALARASEGAGGALQASQAGNQLLAVQARQLADLTALVAAQSQAAALEQARAAAAAADAEARFSRFLGRPTP
jgi:P-type conjugative transfer protein TrbJ